MSVKIEIHGSAVTVESPYNERFVAKARRLGGKWNPGEKCWAFDARSENLVRDLCQQIYGDDGITADTVTLRVRWTERGEQPQGSISLGGRVIASASGKNSRASWGRDVVVLAGYCGSGGTTKYWHTWVDKGTVVLLRDFPRTLAEQLCADPSDPICTIEPEQPVIDREALAAERERLLGRVAEIDSLLGGAVGGEQEQQEDSP